MKKISLEEIQKIVEDFGYELLDEYVDGSIRKIVIRDESGYKYGLNFNGLIRCYSPNFVGNNNPFTLSHNIPLWLEKENKSFILCDNNIYKGAHGKLFFQCLSEDCQELFDMSWRDVYRGQECPFCNGQRVGKYNNLSYLRPDLVAEWDYKRNKSNPENYTEFSHEKVSWICSKCGNPWEAQINNRSNGRGCSKCADARKESKVANEIKEYFKENYNAKDEYRILKNPDTGYWLPYDIYIPYGGNPDLNGFYIEVHWEQHYKFIPNWHKTKEKFEYNKNLDKIKKRFSKRNGTYIEIDLRKIKTTEEAIEHIENILEQTLSKLG